MDVPADEIKCEELEKITVVDNPKKFFQVGTNLPLQEKERLLEFLRANIDVFAWSPYEAPGVDPSFICHRLNVNPSVVPKTATSATIKRTCRGYQERGGQAKAGWG